MKPDEESEKDLNLFKTTVKTRSCYISISAWQYYVGTSDLMKTERENRSNHEIGVDDHVNEHCRELITWILAVPEGQLHRNCVSRIRQEQAAEAEEGCSVLIMIRVSNSRTYAKHPQKLANLCGSGTGGG